MNWLTSFQRNMPISSRRAQRRAKRKNAKAQVSLERLEDRCMPTVDLTGVGFWQERGPGPIIDGDADVQGSQLTNPVIGAVEALAPHPTNKNILYAGTVNGGVWKTFDAYAPDPFWVPLTDQFPSISISSLAFSPMDSTHNTLFAGLGPTSNDGVIGGPQNGPRILRTTDGGVTWTQLGSGLTGLTVASVVPTNLGGDPAHQVILVAAHDSGFLPKNKSGRAGIYVSIDGGVSFHMVVSGTTTEIVADPGVPTRFYAGVGQAAPGGGMGLGVFRSNSGGLAADGGLTWTNVSNNLTGIPDASRIRLATFNSFALGQNVVYAGIIDSHGLLTGVFRSDNQGASWTVMGDSGFGDTNPPQVIHKDDNGTGQGGINFSLTVNPNDVNDVYIAGDEDSAFLGGGSISSVSEWDGDWDQITGPFDRPHSDSRDMVFDAGGQLLESDDGGIYRRVDHDHWTSVIGNLRITEIHSVGFDALNNKVFAGEQDNARSEEQGPSFGMPVWDKWGAGDGGNVGIGYITEDGQRKSIRYGIDNNLLNEGLHFKVYKAGNQLDQDEEAELDNLDSVDGDSNQGDVPHDFPLAVNPFDGNHIVLGGHSLYQSNDRGNTLNTLLLGLSGDLNNTAAVAYGGTFNGVSTPDVVVASFANGVFTTDPMGNTIVDPNYHLFFRGFSGQQMFQVKDPPTGGFALGIALDPDNWRRVYVTDGSSVFLTEDISAVNAVWTRVSGNLSSTALGVGNIHSIAVASPSSTPGDEVLLIGADGGVFRCRNPRAGSSAVWTEVGANLPNAPVFDLHYVPMGASGAQNATEDVLVAGTLGRGAWVLPHALSLLTADSVLKITGDSSSSGPNDQIRLALDPNNFPIFDVFVNSSTPVATMPIAAVGKISVQGLGGDDTLTVDFGTGFVPLPAGGVDFDGGTGSNTFAMAGTVPITPNYTPDADGLPGANGTLDFLLAAVRFKNVAFVPGVAPKITSVQANKTSLTRGTSLTIAGTFLDPGSSSTESVFMSWGDEVFTFTPVGAGIRNFSVTSAVYGTGSSFSIPVSVTDNDNLHDPTAHSVVVNVITPPVIAKSVSAVSVRGSTDLVPLATYTDPSGADVIFPIGIPTPPPIVHYTAVVNWGDSTPLTTAMITYSGTKLSTTGVFSVSGSHAYKNNGTYTVTTTIHHAEATTVVKSTIVVSTILNHPNLTVPGPLVIGASTAGDTIIFRPVGTQTGALSDVIAVFINGVSQGNFTGFLNVEIFGQDGNDDLELVPGIRKNAKLVGGPGNDLLVGSDGNDFLEGDDGNDTLRGNNGNDTLLGGNGIDVLDGGAGTNVLDGGGGIDGVVVHGTNGDDRIDIGRQVGPKGAQLVVQMNGQTFVEDYTNGETVFVFAGKGNDVVRMLPSAGSHWKAEFHGEAGNDQLFGGEMDDALFGGPGNDVLVGGAGNDVLDGGPGRDVLIGGQGADTLLGGRGGDLLIGGRTAFDDNAAALSAVLAEWSSHRSYADRVANLRGDGDGPRANHSYFLIASGPQATVFEDGETDTMTGGSGRDWFFAQLAGAPMDWITDLNKHELVDAL
ncbi:MAG: hypothetical protein HY040_24550 [Planctomycetes bacterium]|nr:hypothetical protein [Planctomycetota bacterium]